MTTIQKGEIAQVLETAKVRVYFHFILTALTYPNTHISLETTRKDSATQFSYVVYAVLRESTQLGVIASAITYYLQGPLHPYIAHRIPRNRLPITRLPRLGATAQARWNLLSYLTSK